MLNGCVTNEDAGRRTRVAIKRFNLFQSTDVPDDAFSAAMAALWKEKHGHNDVARLPKRPVRCQPLNPDEKYCNGCERDLLKSSFCVDRSRRDGLSNRCRECNARSWKAANHYLCVSCDGWCVGHTCRRCLKIQIAVRDAEGEALGAIPFLLARANREFENFLLGIRRMNVSPHERLRLLLARLG